MQPTDVDASEREKYTKMQVEMQKLVDTTAKVDNVRYAAGCDLTVDGDYFIGGFVVVDMENDLTPIYEKCIHVHVDIPYIAGLLCFREGPVVMQCLEEFQKERPEIKIDVLLVDANGIWHPRGFGLACYVGILSKIPTIGVSKSFLFVNSEHTAKSVHEDAQKQCRKLHDVMKIEHVTENSIHIECGVMRTTTVERFNPVYVSCGHLIDLDSSISIVRSLSRFREPEPLRIADRISRQYVRTLKAKPKL